MRRFQYIAIDDVTRFRALKIYNKHTQANAIDFIDHIIEKFPIRIREVRTDNGHEFQAKFHWHVEDKGIRHAYIKRGTPELNGKVERSHRSDQQEFYQHLSYKEDVDLEAKLDEWERFYNFARPHGAHKGQTPYEALRDKLQKRDKCSTGQPRFTPPQLAGEWHLDEVVILIKGEKHWLWRAVDSNGDVLDILVHPPRNKSAAERFFRKLFRRWGRPCVLVTDKLRS